PHHQRPLLQRRDPAAGRLPGPAGRAVGPPPPAARRPLAGDGPQSLASDRRGRAGGGGLRAARAVPRARRRPAAVRADPGLTGPAATLDPRKCAKLQARWSGKTSPGRLAAAESAGYSYPQAGPSRRFRLAFESPLDNNTKAGTGTGRGGAAARSPA